MIIGADECGWGALFGELVVCGVRADQNWKIDGLKDSKQLTPKRRKELQEKLVMEQLKGNIRFWIAARSNNQIDEFGCYVMLKDAYIEVFRELYKPQARMIADGNLKFGGLGVDDYNIESIVKADQTIPIVSAASIIGKVYRDGMMEYLHDQYPNYDLKNSHGYPSPLHLEALKKYGISDLHRKSYRPMKDMIAIGSHNITSSKSNEI